MPDSNQYQVIAGGRRLKALQHLFDDDVIAFDYPVPCLVTTEDTAGSEISLAENVVRAEIHPADQVETFVKLIEMGNTPSEIANRFGPGPIHRGRNTCASAPCPPPSSTRTATANATCPT